MGAAAAPILIGSALGAVTNRRNPLQGALLGGVLGGFGGAAFGAGNAASTAAMTGAAPASMGVAPVAAAATPASALQGASSAIFANPTMPVYGATGGSTGLISSMTAPVTMADRFGAMTQFARENPMATQLGASAAKDIFSQQPQPALQSGLLRGSQVAPQEQPQFAMARPPINLLG